MVDRGGLNYPIRVKDNFSKTTKLFQQEMRASKKAFNDFQSAKVRRVAGPKSDAELIKRELKAQQKALAEAAKQQKARERTAIALRNRATADRKREDARIAKVEAARLRAIKKREQAEARAAAALKRQNKSAGDLLFKFRRLVGTLAVFTAARRGFQIFNETISSAIKFNDTVQASTLGIAGLLTALGDVKDEFGNVVAPAQQLGVAVGIARKQIAALRQDSLRTVATFEQLLDTFQVAVGPGLAAGLDLDEIRTLSVQISQAATALSVPQNQLAEEIRSLLAGTIQARTTRIATALGIDNEDIRQMKAAGTLFASLTKGLEGFSAAAEAAARGTISGIGTLLKGAFSEALGLSAQDLTANLLANLNQLFDLVVTTTDELGNIRPNPQFVAAFQQVFDALSRGVDALRSFAADAGFEGLDATMSAIAATIDVIVGALKGAGLVILSLVRVAIGFADLLGVTAENAGTLAQNAAAAAISFFAIEKAINGFGKLNPIVLAMAAIALSAKELVDHFTGVKTSIKDTVQLLGLGLGKAFVSVNTTVRSVAANISQAFSRAIDEIVASARIAALKTFAFFARRTLTSAGDLAASDAEAQAARIKADAKIATDATKAAGEKEIAAIELRGKQRQEALDREIAEILNAADKRTTTGGEPEFAPPGPGDPGGEFEARTKGSVEIEKRITLLKQEQGLLNARARAAQAIQVAAGARVSNVEASLVAARSAVSIAQAELDVKKRQAKEELDLIAAKARSTKGAESEQQRELFEVVAARRQAELEVLATQVRQTQELARQAELVKSGTLEQGFSEGLLRFGQEFASEFNAGLEVATAALNGFVDFASSAIVDAFDPTKDVDIVERFARLMQQIAQVLIAELIKIAIAKKALEAATPSPGAVVPGLGIPIGVFGSGFNKGGPVPHWGPKAQGLAAGGRPAHIPSSDTIPAWLTPGEFVMRKSAVDSIGISTLAALNSGNFGVTGSSDAAGASTGMAAGGTVRDSIAPSGGGQGGAPVVLPAIVASERAVDQLNAGGRRAAIAFSQENADEINFNRSI